MKPEPASVPVDWEALIGWVRVGGVEQGVLDVETGRVVSRLLTDGEWESEAVAEEVSNHPDRFEDLPHPAARERTVWRTRFADRHDALRSVVGDIEAFGKLVRKRRLWEEWIAFERAIIVALLHEWFRRLGLRPVPDVPPDAPAPKRRR